MSNFQSYSSIAVHECQEYLYLQLGGLIEAVNPIQHAILVNLLIFHLLILPWCFYQSSDCWLHQKSRPEDHELRMLICFSIKNFLVIIQHNKKVIFKFEGSKYNQDTQEIKYLKYCKIYIY